MTSQDKPLEEVEGLRVLVVDDEPDIRHGIQKLVATLGATVHVASDGVEAVEALEHAPVDLVLTDLMMPRMSGSELLGVVKDRHPDTAVVVLTGYGTIQSVVACMQGGAANFITKPFDNHEVLTLVSRLGRQLLATRSPADAARDDGIVAEDPAMQSVMRLAENVARSPLPVLIEGESGTGKELVARAIHAQSAVKDRPFVAVNAAALPDTLLESELFGHRRGAFTGADRHRDGLFQEVRGGSVFLDELSSMSPPFQGKLLRVLQEKVVRPLGGDADVQVDFRLITATNRNLESMARAGEFREDLYYRLSVARIHIPPLRERPGDVVALAARFLALAAETCLGPGARPLELAPSAVEALRRHAWPGNVRELENAMYRASITCRGRRIFPHHLGLSSSSWRSPGDRESVDYAEGKQRAIEEFQREFVERALERTSGNVSHAAQHCGLTRAALQRILKQLAIDPREFREA